MDDAQPPTADELFAINLATIQAHRAAQEAAAALKEAEQTAPFKLVRQNSKWRRHMRRAAERELAAAEKAQA